MVEFGVQLPVQAQSTLMAFQWEAAAGPAEIAAVAEACDRHGYGYVGVCDHVAIPRELAPRMTTVWYDTLATLELARRRGPSGSSCCRTCWCCPFATRWSTAKGFATLDVLSGGRAILGVGVGHAEGEFAALGVPFGERGGAPTTPSPPSGPPSPTSGRGEVGQAPRPVQPGGPPIWVGGSSPAALRRAARLGDGWLPQGPPAAGMAATIAALHEERDRAGRGDRPFAVGGGFSCYVGEPGWDVPPGTVCGPPDELATHVAGLEAIGVTHVQVRVPSRSAGELVDQLEAFAGTVAPALTSP